MLQVMGLQIVRQDLATEQQEGLPQWLRGKESTCNAGDAGEAGDAGDPGQEDPLEEEMATHSSIPAWTIPWAEEPCGPQSMGSQRVGHD